MSIKMKIVIGVIVFIAFILAQNTGAVVFQFLFWQVSMSKIILAPLMILTGGIIGFFIGRSSWDWDS